MNKVILLLALLIYGPFATPSTNRYESVAKVYSEHALSTETIANAKMQGECLVQLKDLTFKKKNEFDPISEWVNYRSVSLLENYSPCEVLIMLETANERLREEIKNEN